MVGYVFALVGGGLAGREVRGLMHAVRVLRYGTITDGTVVRAERPVTRGNRVTQ